MSDGSTPTMPAAAEDPVAQQWSTDPLADPWRDPSTRPSLRTPGGPPPVGPQPLLLPPRIMWSSWWVSALIAGVLVAGLAAGAVGYLIADGLRRDKTYTLNSGTGPNELAKRPPDSLAGIVDRVQPGVVTVAIDTAGTQGNGSGFVLSKEGYILTNNHVAAAGQSGNISVVFSDGSATTASVIGADSGSDLAVIKVDKEQVSVLPLGDSDATRVGDPVIAFGAPLGLAGTVTSGIVSAIDRPVVTTGQSGGSVEDEAYMAAIQTDAAINPGNSGGPLVDGSGRVVGINSAIATAPGSEGSIGLGFAIPMNHAKRVAEQLINDGKARTTVIGATLDRSFERSGSGVRLQDVDADGPAQGAGLKSGDIVTRFDGRAVEDATALIALVRKQAAGTKVTIEYERDNEQHSAQVTLTERPS